MTISYKWLSDYLPETIAVSELSQILTSIGLEVESITSYENIKGGLKGLVVGEVVRCEAHPNADKLKITHVKINNEGPLLQIVCGASNIATGQKVIVALVGTILHPFAGNPFAIKLAKIRGVESVGMICAEDEIGISNNHAGIIVLPSNVTVGTLGSDYFTTYEDTIFEIGLTPNRMDAMSHFGVAKDVCAYLSHHQNKKVIAQTPFTKTITVANTTLPIAVKVADATACPRYAGVSISGVQVLPSPIWLQNKLRAIGLRSINNIVDVTNFILHETGQPLHAFDADAINGGKIVVKKLPQDTRFIALDETEKKLESTDLIICNDDNEPLCMAGVFGGARSSVTIKTKNIFLESACFNAANIRKTSLHHGLRTDAALRFEKGVDIENVVNVLIRAALLIQELCGGKISSEIVDIYTPKPKQEVVVSYTYVQKLSGKNYSATVIQNILTALGFTILEATEATLKIAVPSSKPDISLPADIVEEILRIDGLDNIPPSNTINIAPALSTSTKFFWRNKLSHYLVGQGFYEIVTNSISNSKYFLLNKNSIALLNNLSSELDMLRPSMLETGLECIAYNNNRQNKNLSLFEFGTTYYKKEIGSYIEEEHLTLYVTGNANEATWQKKATPKDIYYAKGIATAVLQLLGIQVITFEKKILEAYTIAFNIQANGKTVGQLLQPNNKQLAIFDVKQPVFCIDFYCAMLLALVAKQQIAYKEVIKFPTAQRDLAIVIDASVPYQTVIDTIEKLQLKTLKAFCLFDVFENEKLGQHKKSMAINFTFLNEEKTLTDGEVEQMMNTIVRQMEKNLSAIIRK